MLTFVNLVAIDRLVYLGQTRSDQADMILPSTSWLCHNILRFGLNGNTNYEDYIPLTLLRLAVCF